MENKDKTVSIKQDVSSSEEKSKEVLLSEIEVKDPNTALNVLVSFVNLANKRGAFSLQESAKIWECVSQFQKGTL